MKRGFLMPSVNLYDEPYADLMWLLDPATIATLRALVAERQPSPQDAPPEGGDVLAPPE